MKFDFKGILIFIFVFVMHPGLQTIENNINCLKDNYINELSSEIYNLQSNLNNLKNVVKNLAVDLESIETALIAKFAQFNNSFIDTNSGLNQIPLISAVETLIDNELTVESSLNAPAAIAADLVTFGQHYRSGADLLALSTQLASQTALQTAVYSSNGRGIALVTCSLQTVAVGANYSFASLAMNGFNNFPNSGYNSFPNTTLNLIGSFTLSITNNDPISAHTYLITTATKNITVLTINAGGGTGLYTLINNTSSPVIVTAANSFLYNVFIVMLS